ncbi:MAG: hypothetical protein JEZ11_18815 [Desulfobacterales bacterium]|nr:hypothetical protein [Desulfobacterales bacterium]
MEATLPLHLFRPGRHRQLRHAAATLLLYMVDRGLQRVMRLVFTPERVARLFDPDKARAVAAPMRLPSWPDP